MFKMCTRLAAAIVAAGLLSSAAFAHGGDGGAWQRNVHPTTGVCIPIFGACGNSHAAAAKHKALSARAAHHKLSKKKVAAASCVYSVTVGGRGGNQTHYYTAANFGGC